MLGGSIHTRKRNTGTLVVANKEIDPEVNAEKTKYMVTSRDQNAEQNHSMKISSTFFKGCKSAHIREEI